jgi:hypothetical protein
MLAASAAAKTPVATADDSPPQNASPADSLLGQLFIQTLGEVPAGDVPGLDIPGLGIERLDALPLVGDANTASPSTLIYLRVSREYLSMRFEKEVDRTKPVTDMILGTRIRGESLTRGKTRMVLIPSDDKFVAEIEFIGTVDSRTRGTNGPAILHYKSASTFRATKRIKIDAGGLTTAPARAKAKTELQPLRIESRSGGLVGMIVERVARRRVAESRQQANSIASDHTADTVAGDLDRGLEKSLGVLTATLAEAAGLRPAELAQLATNGAGQRLHVMLRTTRDHAELVLAPEQATWPELARVLPTIDGSPHVALRVHRSILTSTGASSSGSPALARLLAHGLKTQLAKRSAAMVALPAKGNDLPIDWSIGFNWLCVDVCRPQPAAADAFRSTQVEVEPLQPSIGGGE